MSPVIVRCSECGYVLNEDKGANFGFESSAFGYMKTIIKRHGGKCPKCGHLLTLPPKTVEVKPYPTRFGEKAAGSSHQDSPQGGYADLRFPGVGRK